MPTIPRITPLDTPLSGVNPEWHPGAPRHVHLPQRHWPRAFIGIPPSRVGRGDRRGGTALPCAIAANDERHADVAALFAHLPRGQPSPS